MPCCPGGVNRMTNHQQSAVSLKKITRETDCLSQKLKAER
jgi:hypothetical protein